MLLEKEMHLSIILMWGFVSVFNSLCHSFREINTSIFQASHTEAICHCSPQTHFFVQKPFRPFFFPSSKWEQTGSEPIIPRILTYERNYRFFLLHCQYIHWVTLIKLKSSTTWLSRCCFFHRFWLASSSGVLLQSGYRFSCVTGIFIFSSRYKSRRAMLVMSEGRLGRNLHIYQIFTSEETWMLIICIIAKVAAQVVR